jgi:hypothetical protein
MAASLPRGLGLCPGSDRAAAESASLVSANAAIVSYAPCSSTVHALLSAGLGSENPLAREAAAAATSHITAVALANKNARVAWALLSGGEAYDPGLAIGSA